MVKSNMFLNYFKPSLYVENFKQVNLKALRRHGIKVFIADLDNTLVPHFKKLPTPDVFEFVKKVEDQGMHFVLVSNNTKKRVKRFADKLGVDYYAAAFKPRRKTAEKISDKYGVDATEMVIMGDQLITDIFWANRFHMDSILVQPLISRDLKVTKFNRFLERILYKRLQKNNILHKDKFDESGVLGDIHDIL